MHLNILTRTAAVALAILTLAGCGAARISTAPAPRPSAPTAKRTPAPPAWAPPAIAQRPVAPVIRATPVPAWAPPAPGERPEAPVVRATPWAPPAPGERPEAPVVMPRTVKFSGRVEDTMGRPLHGVLIRIESDSPADGFNKMAIGRNGSFEAEVPTGQWLRFSASKRHHRTVTFVQRVSEGGAPVEFTGFRALEPLPTLDEG